MNAVIDSLLSHRAIRSFRPDPIAEDVLEAILEAGTRAATHFQPYSLLVIDDTEILGAVAPYEAPLAVISTLDLHRFQRYLGLYSAEYPVDSAMNLFLRYWDAVLALQNVVVAAERLGLGTVYIDEAPGMDLHKRLGLPENVFPAGLVLIGHPAEEPPENPRFRLPTEAVVHRSRYREPNDNELEAWYDRHEEMFDRHYEPLSDEEKQRLASEGVDSRLQRFCHVEGTFYREADAAVLTNLEHGGFHVADWGTTN